jgi:hypothetical protein
MIMPQNLQAVIFPHASVSEVNLKKVLSLFERVLLFQPWFMEKAPSLAEDLPDIVQVLNPPERLKPGEDFRSLLSEYRQWIRLNKGKGFPAFLAYGEDRFQDPRVYEIRGMIRNMGKSAGEEEKAKALQWHLTLHLTEELEEAQEGAEALFKAAGQLDSPLKGAIEEEDLPGLLSDVPGMERESFFTEERLAQILEAWVCLHGENVPDRGPLVTLSPQVLQYLKEIWEEAALESQGSSLPEWTFHSPDLSASERDDFRRRRETALTGTGLKQAVADFCHDPGRGFPQHESAAEEPEKATGSLQWTLVYLLPAGKDKFPGKYRFMQHLSGKIIGLVQDAARNER